MPPRKHIRRTAPSWFLRTAPHGASSRRRRGGQALVELALILPIMLVLFSSALDLGRLYYSQITINNAAKEGALEASRHPNQFDNTRPCDADDNTVICLVINEAKGSLISITPSDVQRTCDPDPCSDDPSIGDTVAIDVTSHFSLVTPLLSVFFGGQSFDIHSTSTAQLYVTPNPGGTATPTPTPTPAPSPTPVPTPTPTPSPGASPTPTPAPSPTPTCVAPTGSGGININPGAGQSVLTGTGTVFTMTAPTVNPQPGCTFVYTWSFGDGASASGTSVTHQYQKKGNGSTKAYTVTLVISVQTVATSWTLTKTVVVNP